jgi:hypothetical protein
MKKFISLFLVFYILALLGNMFAKERYGAELLIQKIDGTQVRGELIAIKQNSLLLLERDSNADMSVLAENIEFIIIVKKSKVLLGIGLGLLLGGGLGSLYGTSTDTYYSDLRPLAFIVYGGGGAVLGALIGGFFSASAGKDETIQIEGRSDSEIQEILEKLHKKARIKNAQ